MKSRDGWTQADCSHVQAAKNQAGDLKDGSRHTLKPCCVEHLASSVQGDQCDCCLQHVATHKRCCLQAARPMQGQTNTPTTTSNTRGPDGWGNERPVQGWAAQFLSGLCQTDAGWFRGGTLLDHILILIKVSRITGAGCTRQTAAAKVIPD